MEILKTPWKERFLDLVYQSKKSIKMTSPYLKSEICKDILKVKNSNSKIYFITSFKVKSIYSGALDISALENIIYCNGIIKSYPKLHSKIYLFDDKRAVITSSNLTIGGMLKNFEYGILIEEQDCVRKILNDFEMLLKNEKTGTITYSSLEVVKNILSKLPKITQPSEPIFEIESPEESFDILENSKEQIQSSLKGWKREVFKCINMIPNQIFTLKEINKFENYLSRIYPSNKHIQDKIRQQLQYLRDLGLIEFLGSGRYKKLWN